MEKIEDLWVCIKMSIGFAMNICANIVSWFIQLWYIQFLFDLFWIRDLYNYKCEKEVSDIFHICNIVINM